ncbi:MAG: universal stress protein [Bacteroidia bacterium]|nr:universal stress protein [Bacteroidia bacterium]
MRNVKRILVPTDFSAIALNALHYAIWLAGTWKADIHLLHVDSEDDAPNRASSSSTQLSKKRGRIPPEQQMNAVIDSVKSRATTKGAVDNLPIITSEIKSGTPSLQIEIVVEQMTIDLIIMGIGSTNKETDYKREMVRLNTLKKASCPILLIPEKLIDPKIQTIAYATGLNEADPLYIWRIEKLFKPFNPTMHIVHILKDKDEELTLTMRELEEFLTDQRADVSTIFHTISSKSRTKALMKFEKERDVDLMVMSKPHRGFFAGLFHTSVSKQMVYNIIVPLLILKQ